jgi:hypothetical protein
MKIEIEVNDLSESSLRSLNAIPEIITKFCRYCKEILTDQNWPDFNKNRLINGEQIRNGWSSYCCNICTNQKQREVRRERRKQILEEYGGKCVCCGETKELYLDVDHIKNDGNKERRAHVDMNLWIIKQGFPKDKYQLLCRNCNRTKMLLCGSPCNCQDPESRKLNFKPLGRKPENVNPIRCGIENAICTMCTVKLNEQNCYSYDKALRREIKIKYYCKSCVAEKRANRTIANRNTIIKEYGGKCNSCGYDHPLSLEIDHINNDGGQERKELKIKDVYNYLIQNNFPKDRYQLLCSNCNYEKNIEVRGFLKD